MNGTRRMHTLRKNCVQKLWWNTRIQAGFNKHWLRMALRKAVPVYAMKVWTGNGSIVPPILNIGIWWMWVVRLTIWSFTPRKTPSNGGWVDPSRCGRLVTSKICCPSRLRLQHIREIQSDGLEGTLVAADRGQLWTVVNWLTNSEAAQIQEFAGQVAHC